MQIDPGSEGAPEGSEGRGEGAEDGRSASPPPSGLARSLRSLFERRDSPSPLKALRTDDPLPPPTDPAHPEVEPVLADGVSGEGDADTSPEVPDETDNPNAPKRSAVRDRFVTRIASWLTASPDSRDRYRPGILEDAALLRKEGGFHLVLDGVASLVGSLSGGTTLEAGREALGSDGVGPGDSISLAGEIMDPLLAHYLALRIGAETDPTQRDPLVRIARAFPRLSAPALAEILVEADDRDARRIMQGILGGLGREGREAARALLRDPRWYAVRNGVMVLAASGDPDVVQALTVVLAHTDRRVRKEAVMALSQLGGEDAGLLLIAMLNDPEPDVREMAVIGVGGLRVTRALRPLLEMVATETEEEVLAQVLLALGELGDPGAVPAIEKKALGSLFSRPPRTIRLAAYRALAAIGTPHARSIVEAGMGDRDAEVSRAIRDLLGRRGVEPAPPAT